MIWNKLFSKKKAPIDNKKDNTPDASVKDAQPQDAQPQDAQENNLHEVASPICVKNINSQTEPSTETEPTLPLFQFDDVPEKSVNAITSPQQSKSRFVKFLAGLKKSRTQMTNNLSTIFSGDAVSVQMLDDLEDVLLQADLGTEISAILRNQLEKEKFGKNIDESEIKKFLATQIEKFLAPVEGVLTLKRDAKPNVILFVGVNGSGKTTTIGKFAKHFKQSGQKVMLAAGDTFRAAAVEQLTVWGERNNVPVFSRPQNADPAGLVYDAYAHALETQTDILLIDTAGRLQNKHNLMQELLKIVRVLQKYDATLPHEIIMVLDATTGQNALRQAEVFRDMADISGIIMTKLDGSAKGGVLVPIGHKMKLPVYAIGIGENIEDLKLFSAKDFSEALIGHASDKKFVNK